MFSQSAGETGPGGVLQETQLHQEGGGGPEGEDLGAGHQHQEQPGLLRDQGGGRPGQYRVGRQRGSGEGGE